MNAKKLAEKMLEYSSKMEEAKALEKEITVAVLELGETLTVGNVKAVYRNGRKKYDYQSAIESQPDIHQDYFEEYTKIIKRIDYRGMCKAVRIPQDEIPCTIGAPSVAIKLV